MRQLAPGLPHLHGDDRTLATKARTGDRRAFDSLVHLYLERTFHVALRLVGNREDAEDVTQETFARAHVHLHQFRGKSSFGTWVTSICVRLCLDHQRKRKRTPDWVPLEEPRIESQLAVQQGNPGDAASFKETRMRLERAIGELPRRLRTAFVLRVLEGMEYEDVAEILGTTIRSSRIYVSEARRRLAKHIPPGGDA